MTEMNGYCNKTQSYDKSIKMIADMGGTMGKVFADVNSQGENCLLGEEKGGSSHRNVR